MNGWKKYGKVENAWGQVAKICHEYYRFLYLPSSMLNMWNILFPRIYLILLESVETNWYP